MVVFHALAGLLALASPLMVLADVNPSEPGPGSIFKAGSKCHVTWQGDTDSTTAWKDMAIELMSGSNLNMVPVTTVATNQDGTKDGSFEHTCPEVTPNSAIYFYQLSSSHTTTKTWTTRFTIQGADGSSTPPANPTQPSGDPIPWGIGRLVNADAVVPPPFAGSNSTSPTASSSVSSNSSTVVPSNSKLVVTPSPSSSSLTSSNPASSTSSAKGSTATSGTIVNAAYDRRMWMTALATFLAVFL